MAESTANRRSHIESLDKESLMSLISELGSSAGRWRSRKIIAAGTLIILGFVLSLIAAWSELNQDNESDLKETAQSRLTRLESDKNQLEMAELRLKAAEANERSKKLEQENLILRTDLAKIKTPRDLEFNDEVLHSLKLFTGTPYTVLVFNEPEAVFLATKLVSILDACKWSYVESSASAMHLTLPLSPQRRRVRIVTFAGVAINWSNGQFNAARAVGDLFSRNGISTAGFGSGRADEVVAPTQQTPMQIVIGQKTVR